jgi:hypothetical protein
MTPALIVHISAGAAGILSGAGALTVRKGERLHRIFGTVFFVFILIMAAMGAYLATLLPQAGTTIAGMFTIYFVATAWVTVKRPVGSTGSFEKLGCLAAFATAAALLLLGLRAAHSPTGTFQGAPAARYFAFAAFATFAAGLDLKVILQGGIACVARIARHLWRMCFALFFAASSFFLGQQKAMPAFMRESPLLFVPAFAPLLLLIFWSIRVRYPRRLRNDVIAS